MTSDPGSSYSPKQRYIARGNSHEPLARLSGDRSSIAYAVVSLASVYFLLYTLRRSPLAVPRFLWEIIVYLTPSRLVAALDKEGAQENKLSGYPSLRDKGEAMQRIIGCGANSILPTFPRSRAYSSLSSVLLGSREAHPPGLGNWDNSCYQNSIIQGLASLDSLREFLGSNIQNLGHRHFLSTHIALREIIDQLNDPANSGQKLWLPAELKSMCSWQQQDAQEYFAKIADQIDKEIRQASRGVTGNIGFKLAPHSRCRSEERSSSSLPETQDGSRCTIEPDTDRNSIPRCSPMEGLLAQRVGCMECGWTEGLSLIPFNCLTVTLGKNWEYDIRECLDEYTSLESIEGVDCAKCTLLRTKAQLESLLAKLEPVDESKEDGTDARKLGDALRRNAEARLGAVQETLQAEDFCEKTLKEKCHISPRNHVASTKSKQAVIARAPKSLIIHVNRSVFDEMTGALRKNYADVRFPNVLDLEDWCLGKLPAGSLGDDTIETWAVDPSESMLPQTEDNLSGPNRRYELKAAITHYGRHENGHYICYRKHSVYSFPTEILPAGFDIDGEKEKDERWFRLSDDDVSLVSEKTVLAQGGVFMLCYELIESSSTITNQTGHVLSCSDFQPVNPPLTEDGIPLDDIIINANKLEAPTGDLDFLQNHDEEISWVADRHQDSRTSSSLKSPENSISSSTTEEPSVTNNAQHLASTMKTANSHLNPKDNPNTSSISRLISAK